MRLKKEFVVHEMGSESFLVPLGGADWSGVVKGNKTFGAVLQLLKEDISEAEIIKAMINRFDAPEAVITDDVRKALSELRKIGAIME